MGIVDWQEVICDRCGAAIVQLTQAGRRELRAMVLEAGGAVKGKTTVCALCAAALRGDRLVGMEIRSPAPGTMVATMTLAPPKPPGGGS